ncbi:hypothetical protein BDF22DRAFT_740094 [Syncephalis plumigaleata]|nr:hypothetical protein BDF22DRAFT_740094 [Syncephalis plumigaleata]
MKINILLGLLLTAASCGSEVNAMDYVQKIGAAMMQNTVVRGKPCGLIGVTTYGCIPPYACVPNPFPKEPKYFCASFARPGEQCDNKDYFCREEEICAMDPRSNTPYNTCVDKAELAALLAPPNPRLSKFRSG